MKQIIITVTDEPSIEFVSDGEITWEKSADMLNYAYMQIGFVQGLAGKMMGISTDHVESRVGDTPATDR